ncbi:hypothetical protein CMO88_04900 [Candidatus Woesearchaeota archaeon]|nr:hypothetical protein [Candidatus Woesearchaeota archaeon]|tara:strand:- start:14377 stop:14694 length:318 start_codon:yes stop_codon:yes gene_type:complete
MIEKPTEAHFENLWRTFVLEETVADAMRPLSIADKKAEREIIPTAELVIKRAEYHVRQGFYKEPWQIPVKRIVSDMDQLYESNVTPEYVAQILDPLLWLDMKLLG